jgi:exodeoxyribonuclease V beta subunit
MAILVTRNVDAMLFQEALARLNIPAVLKKSGNIFQTAEADAVERLLQAICASGNTRQINGALATPMIGFCAEDIRSFVEDENRFEVYEQHLQNFHEYNELWNTKGFMRMFRKFLSDYNVRQKLLRLPDGQRRLTNLLHIAELIHTAAAENRLGTNGVLSWIFKQRAAEEEKEEQELRLESDDEAVQILTVFKSKGLEYPIVFCPFMWQQGAAITDDKDFIFHDKGSTYLDIGSPERHSRHKALAGKENLSELIRLLYVAVTRARNRCYIACGKIGSAAASSLDYLFTGGMDKDKDFVSTLKNKISSLSEDDLFREIKNYTEGSRGTICLTDPGAADPEPYQPKQDKKAGRLSARKFSAKINTDWAVASYSSLTSGDSHGFAAPGSENLKQDEAFEQTESSPSKSAAPKGFFSFPRGALPGSCIHTIFEKLDFTSRNASMHKSLIYDSLKNYGLDPGEEDMDKNRQVADVHDMLAKVLNSPLLPDRSDFILSKISAENRVAEMGFYYPLKRLVPGTLKDIFKKYAGRPDFENLNFPERIEDLEFRPTHGFMQGFIDLVFCFEGKYYLLDWKTNYLGSSYADYSGANLLKSMQDTFYILQYYIYALALHRYLQARVSEYSYEKHFGGVFYLYVRGITPELPGNGIFFDRPPKALVAELGRLCGE